eukprot:365468-Chlamydomonas_euryale.AAC.6
MPHLLQTCGRCCNLTCSRRDTDAATTRARQDTDVATSRARQDTDVATSRALAEAQMLQPRVLAETQMLQPYVLAETQMLQGMPGSGELMHWPAGAMGYGVLKAGAVCTYCSVQRLGKWSDIILPAPQHDDAHAAD